MVVVGSPLRDCVSCIRQAQEPVLVKSAVPELAVEAFDERILLGLTRIDVVPRHGILIGPLQDRPTGELCAVAPREEALV